MKTDMTLCIVLVLALAFVLSGLTASSFAFAEASGTNAPPDFRVALPSLAMYTTGSKEEGEKEAQDAADEAKEEAKEDADKPASDENVNEYAQKIQQREADRAEQGLVPPNIPATAANIARYQSGEIPPVKLSEEEQEATKKLREEQKAAAQEDADDDDLTDEEKEEREVREREEREGKDKEDQY